MRVSEYFKLDYTQPSLEFIDVDISGDTPLFIDPRALKYIRSTWGNKSVSLVQNYFQTVINAIRSGDDARAKQLLQVLSEPNETHLGYSKNRAHGHGMGKVLARTLWRKLKTSDAVRTGLVSDLEDTVLFIPGVSVDIISDIVTNIIREQLVIFTQDMCRYYGIPMEKGVGFKRIWNHRLRKWETSSYDLPLTPDGPLLLVPKSVVRKVSTFDPDEYYRHYIAPFLQEQELESGGSLVEVLKNDKRRVTKKSIKEKFGAGKGVNLEVTATEIDILEQYRMDKSVPEDALSHEVIANATSTELPDWDNLLQAVLDVKPGIDTATLYHRAVEKLISALMHPSLDYPQIEAEIHEGRKRIDIRYNNISATGFFYNMSEKEGISCATIPFECKNYTTDIKNPELDQIAGRFGPNAGWLGFVLCRKIDNKELILKKTKDTMNDDRGFIIVLEDTDLIEMVHEKKMNPDSTQFLVLERKFNDLIS